MIAKPVITKMKSMSKRRDVRRNGGAWTVIEGVELPTREVKVAGKWFESPRHINRIDIPDKKTHGWQVRYRGKSGFFADIKQTEGDFAASLEKAKEFLQSIYRDDIHLTKFDKPSKEHKDKGLKLYPGVSGLWRNAIARNVYEFYFQVIVPVYGPSKHRNIKVYACTENTLTKELVNEKAGLAIAIRRYFENLYTQRDVETASVMTLKKLDSIDLTEFETKYQIITLKKLDDLLIKAKIKWG